MWLREAISDGRTGKASTKRIVMLISGFALSASTVLLTAAVFFGFDVSGPLAAFGTSLAVMAGGGYVGGKAMESRREEKNNEPV